MITSIREWIKRTCGALVIGLVLAIIWQAWLLIVDGELDSPYRVSRVALGLAMLALVADRFSAMLGRRAMRSMVQQTRHRRPVITEPPAEPAMLAPGEESPS